MSSTATRPSPQSMFDSLSRPLSEVIFVVVDLETTGTGADAEITEIGAVKVRGGVTLDEFHSLVQPRSSIPSLISALTGITNAMVADAPDLTNVMPAFLDFAGESVLVAHNARFDIGFLKRACESCQLPWGNHSVVDTLALARHLIDRNEVPNYKLGTLAAFFRATKSPTHRALDDARATVDVLHGLIERIDTRGV